MINVLLTFLLCLLLGGSLQAQMDPQQDTALRSIVQQQAEAWNRGDAAAWAAPFSDDASFVNVRGDAVSGRTGIEALHSAIFSSFYKGSHTVVTVDHIRPITPDVAIVDTVHEVSHIAMLPPGVAVTENGVLRARMRYVAVRQDGVWKFVAAQNTAISPRPLTKPAQ